MCMCSMGTHNTYYIMYTIKQHLKHHYQFVNVNCRHIEFGNNKCSQQQSELFPLNTVNQR